MAGTTRGDMTSSAHTMSFRTQLSITAGASKGNHAERAEVTLVKVSEHPAQLPQMPEPWAPVGVICPYRPEVTGLQCLQTVLHVQNCP